LGQCSPGGENCAGVALVGKEAGMCCMGMQGGLFSLVQAVGILTVSFFVLFALRKVDAQGLKVFGLVIAVLLWISAALVFGKGMYGRPGMMDKMKMMGGGMQQQANNPVTTK